MMTYANDSYRMLNVKLQPLANASVADVLQSLLQPLQSLPPRRLSPKHHSRVMRPLRRCADRDAPALVWCDPAPICEYRNRICSV